MQSALCILHLKNPDTARLRQWAESIAARRGKRIAVVAPARRLAGLLFAMMRDGTKYQRPKQRPSQPSQAEPAGGCCAPSAVPLSPGGSRMNCTRS